MPTPRIRYVDTASAGGDGTTQAHSGGTAAYATLDAALTAEVADLVALDRNLIIYCAGSAADTTNTFVWSGSGWTSDATRNISIRGDPAAPHNDGLNLGNSYSTGHYRLEYAGGANSFRILSVAVDFVGLQFGYNASGGGTGIISDEGGALPVLVNRCRFKSLLTPSVAASAITISGNSFTITNCTFNWNVTTNSTAITTAGTQTITNCTISGADIGIYIPSGTTTVKNCAIFNCTDDFLISGTLAGSYIAHDDAAETGETNHIDISPGGTEATNWASAFAGYTTGDFRVKDTSSVLYNAGTNTGAPATDIIGTTRPQATTVDIGAWEFTAGGPSLAIQFHSSVSDNGLAEIVSNATTVFMCSALPTSYTAASSTNKLGSSSISFGSPAASVAGDGRKITSTPITTGNITGPGTVTHWAVCDGSRLLATGEIDAPEVVTSGHVFSLGALSLVGKV